MVEADRVTLRIDAEPLAHGVDYPDVCLVRDEQGDVVNPDISLLQNTLCRLDGRPHRLAEDLPALHHDEAAPVAVEDRH